MAAQNLIHRFRAKSGVSARSAPPNGPAYRSRRFLIAPESNPRRARFCSEAPTAARSKLPPARSALRRGLGLAGPGAPGPILSYVMIGEPLPIHHGFPLRLIVPSWYAGGAGKWLTEIRLSGQPFAGHFQIEKY